MNISFPELELPEMIAEFPAKYLLCAPRPAMVKDFFDPELVCELNVRARTKILQLAWKCQTTFAPRGAEG